MSTLDFDPDDEPAPPRQRWQDELEEILATADRESTATEKVRGHVVTARYQAPAKGRSLVTRLRANWSGGMWLLLFLGLLLLTFVVQHYWPFVGRILALITVGFLVALIVKGIRRQGSEPNASQMWRGRDMSLPREEKPWYSRLFGRKR